MKIVILIPARAGSKRVKNKNIRNLGGKPLMGWSIETALKLGYPCYVSTDSEMFGKIARHYGAKVVMRPPEFASDGATDRDVINHAVHFFEADIVAYLRPTTPFRDCEVLKKAIDIFTARADCPCLRCVEELTESSFKTFTMEGGYLVPALSRQMNANLPNHLYPATYRNNGYLDLYRLPYDDSRVMGYVVPRTVEIDTEFDLWLAEQYYNYKREEKIYDH